MIGKTYLCLNDKEKARLYLTRARDYPVITSEDAEVWELSLGIPIVIVTYICL